jgi:ketosteroid isomerase-like protein
MSQENVAVVQRLYRALNAGDVPGFMELAHPDAVWIPDSRTSEEPIRGRAKVMRFYEERAEMLAELRTEPERFFELDDDKVLAFVRITGHGAASGAGFDIRIAHLWTLRGDVVVLGEGFADRDDALESVGLRD